MGRFLGLRIASRYLFSKKTHNAVNIITGVAVITTAIATAATVIVLSVFNGFRELATERFSKFDPPLEIIRTDHGTFSSDSVIQSLSNIEGIGTMIPIIETKAFVTTSDSQSTVRLIGADEDFLRLSDIQGTIIDGETFIGDTLGRAWGIVSSGTASRLNVRPGFFKSLEIMVPKRKGRINPGSLLSMFRIDSLQVAGVFRTGEQSIDESMIIAPLEMTSYIAGLQENEVTSLYVYPDKSLDKISLTGHLSAKGMEVLDIEQQNPDSYRMIRIEKWISFALLSFILIIASFNIISTLTMLIIEKRGNMSVLNAMGFSMRKIKTVYCWEGILLSFFGGIAGCIIGALLVCGQQIFGWVKFSGNIDPTFLSTNVYPVKLSATDFFVVLGLVIILSVITTLVSVFTISTDDKNALND